MHVLSGKVSVGGRLGYAPQQSWITNKTIRDNVLFNENYNEEFYQKVIVNLSPLITYLEDFRWWEPVNSTVISNNFQMGIWPKLEKMESLSLVARRQGLGWQGKRILEYFHFFQIYFFVSNTNSCLLENHLERFPIYILQSSIRRRWHLSSRRSPFCGRCSRRSKAVQRSDWAEWNSVEENQTIGHASIAVHEGGGDHFGDERRSHWWVILS